jgi:hypothetical protein
MAKTAKNHAKTTQNRQKLRISAHLLHTFCAETPIFAQNAQILRGGSEK